MSAKVTLSSWIRRLWLPGWMAMASPLSKLGALWRTSRSPALCLSPSARIYEKAAQLRVGRGSALSTDVFDVVSKGLPGAGEETRARCRRLAFWQRQLHGGCALNRLVVRPVYALCRGHSETVFDGNVRAYGVRAGAPTLLVDDQPLDRMRAPVSISF